MPPGAAPENWKFPATIEDQGLEAHGTFQGQDAQGTFQELEAHGTGCLEEFYSPGEADAAAHFRGQFLDVGNMVPVEGVTDIEDLESKMVY